MNTMKKEECKKKVIFILGATGTGKSRLSIDLAIRFPAEIINSDKIQVHKGLDIITNKLSKSDQQGVRHHLLGEIDPDSDFTTHDFCNRALLAIKEIIDSGRVPIVAGGSNSYIEALVVDPQYGFRSKYVSCFIWLDVAFPVLCSYLSGRVDQMVCMGLVEEVRAMRNPEADLDRGIRRAIGVKEMENYFRAKTTAVDDDDDREVLLKMAIDEIKRNTCELAYRQLGKIQRLRNELGWVMHRIDATDVFQKCGDQADAAWEKLVMLPSLKFVAEFLAGEEEITQPENIFLMEKSFSGLV